ncbi:DUF6443 domain-containing protein [Flavilitoribacter nigricans]|uniref:Uncharacterized protein n=1 Tax=Flavilitoribacter nigricans (strain ATCC 23147 / DSM 23189 / NBRC 102662 / NCIMB 1420 / SS-2) TaxID=1122177 RepID=A0A2D0MX19_FLAN2|nr:DUF6443 domain-containing protein [Flavilitoribacter nigricans]PHN00804.1 hypothetical protein CRP01_40395 [Flavilitoribacter nigricans DSM 23189 = NBRC 102662]
MNNITVPHYRSLPWICLLIVCPIFSVAFGQGEPGDPGGGPNFAAMRALSLRNKLIVPPSPEAASLGKFGEIQISHYTGALNYSIALPTVGDGKLAWSFSLRYDGSGNKPAQIHGQVGQGWSLEGIGVITRTVRGNPDIDLNYYNASKAWQNNTTTNNNLIAENSFLDSVARGRIETQPDLYHYNFGGHSGKFYIKPDKTIFFEDEVNLLITPTFQTSGFANVNGDILSFSIRDASGYTYVFEYPERTYLQMEPTTGYSPAHTNFEYNSAWYLKEVTHPNGSVVGKLTFLYDQTATYFTPLINVKLNESMTYPQAQNVCGNNYGCGNPSAPTYSYTTYSNTSIRYRKAIKEVAFYKNTNLIEKITFFNSANTYVGNYGNFKLDRIEVKRGPTTSTKLWYKGVFTYDGSTGRLTLKSFKETTGTVEKEPYFFTYNSTVLPVPTTIEQDFWGYYNSNGGPGMIHPYYQNCSSTATYPGNGNRSPDISRMQAGILTKITYPTKGYTEIEYEAHKVGPYDCHTSDQTIGGLRVKEVRHYAKGTTLAHKIQYKYTLSLTSSASSGKLIHRLNYSTNNTNIHYGMNCAAPCCEVSTTYTCSSTTLSPYLIMTPGAVDGPHVGYSRVEEINAGRTVYGFRNSFVDGSSSHSNGDLISKEIYDANNNLLERTAYTYWADGSTGPLPTMYSMVAEAKSEQDNKSLLCQIGTTYEWRLQCCASGAGTGGCLQNKTFDSKLERQYAAIRRRKKYITKEVMTYNSLPYTLTQTSLVKQVEYKYDDLNIFQPTEIKVLDGAGVEISKTIHRYPTVSGPGVPSGMVLARMFSEPVESQNFIKGVHVYSTKKDFKTSSPYIPVTFYEKLGTGAYTTVETANTNDIYSNYTSVTRQYDVPNSYIWTGDGARLTAIVRNAAVNEVAYTSFDSPFTYQGGWTNFTAADIKYAGGASGDGYYQASSGAVTLSSPILPTGKYILSYYTKGGTVAVTPSTSGATILRTTVQSPMLTNGPYGWKYTEHLINKTSTGVYQISIPANAWLDELRIYPADAQMETVSYDRDRYLPQCMSGVDGKVNRFVYDDLNRLIIVKNPRDEIVTMLDYYYQNGSNAYNGIYQRSIKQAGVLTVSAANALPGSALLQSFRYFDGLGRDDQTVAIDWSPDSLEAVTFYTYDTYGRQAKRYLPYTVAANNHTLSGAYQAAPTSAQISFYNDLYMSTTEGTYAVAEQLLEVSPLSRVQGTKSAGAAWSTKPTAVSYTFNGVNEVRNPQVSGQYFAANTLFKVRNTDEDNKVATTYSDLLGRKIMQDIGGLKTYYLYDNYGNLTQVIQPEGAKLLHSTSTNIHTTASIQSRSFLYTYDSRFRLSTKKIPGTGGNYTYQYDRLDRPVLVTDPRGFKTFTKYDILSRPILTGKYTGSTNPTGSEGLYENKATTGHFYTTTLSYPTTGTEIYTVNYYDDYDYDANYVDNITYTVPSQSIHYSDPVYTAVRGQPTGQKAGVLTTAGTAPTVFVSNTPFYNFYGQVIHIKESHPYSGNNLSWTQYHFAGWPLRTRLQQTAYVAGQSKNYVINGEMTYDHAGRKRKTYHQIGDTGPEVEISSLHYNKIEQVDEQIIGQGQTVNYTYNIRGWLTAINNPGTCSTDDLFSMSINYHTANSNLGSTALYNGNISSIEWRTGASCLVNGVSRNKAAYGFTYDSANRLTKAKYGEYNSSNSWISGNVDRYTVDNLAYDDNGNITTIKRRGLTGTGTYGIIDDLTYTYSGTVPNQLTGIAEASLLDRGFKKVSAGASGYTYDNNGNVTVDGYRGITGTTYHPHDLPSKVTYSATKYIEYTYDALGRKWKSKTVDGATTTEKTYLGGIEYVGSNLEAIYHPEGRAVPSGATYEYQYTIRDHLGNSRVMFKMVGTTATIIQEGHYYPFGMEMEGFSTGNDPYRYNGMEWQADLGLGMYDYGARWYDPSIGRWNALDPLAEKFPSESPFNYVGNSPISNIDVGGKYKLPVEFIQKYPNFAKYLQQNVRNDVMNSPAILSALARHTAADSPNGIGNLSPEQVENAVSWGSGPEILVVSDPGGFSGAHGYYYDGQIQLSTKDIEALEAVLAGDGSNLEKLQALLPTYMTLLHETVHYGDYLDGLRQDGGEPGVEFEIDVWGLKGENDDGTKWNAARFFPDEYEDVQGLINAINEFLNSGRSDLLPTVPKNE